MSYLSDSDSDEDMPTLDQLFKSKKRSNTDGQQRLPSSSFLVDDIGLPSSGLGSEKAVGAKVMLEAKQVSRDSSTDSKGSTCGLGSKEGKGREVSSIDPFLDRARCIVIDSSRGISEVFIHLSIPSAALVQL